MHYIEEQKQYERDKYYLELEACNGPCIDHKREGDANGYAIIEYKYRGRRADVYMHRAAYSEWFEIPLETLDGVVIRHMCDNPRCINPWHLEPGTHKDNTQDALRRHRLRSGESNSMSVLDWDTVLMCRERYRNGESIKSLAEYAGVAYSTMSDAVKGKSWKLPEEIEMQY